MTVENPFDTFRPSAREWDGGTFPVKSFQAQNGAELRILYGNRIARRTLKLTYQNINDKNTQKFLEHYWSMQGTYKSFYFRDSNKDGVYAGWTGEQSAISGDGTSEEGQRNKLKWSYASEPVITSVYKGLSTISVELVATPPSTL